jgi:hypothetical protein
MEEWRKKWVEKVKRWEMDGGAMGGWFVPRGGLVVEWLRTSSFIAIFGCLYCSVEV